MTERIEYLDFDVEVESTATANAYAVHVIASPRGEASSTMTFPYSDEGLENVILKLGRTRSGVRALGSPTQQLARTFGSALYDSFFAGEVGTCFRRSLDAADAQGKGLRLRLRLAGAPKLGDVPWEYLYPSGLRKFLVLSRHTPVVRYLDLPREVPPLHVDPPLQVLLVVSAPLDLASLDVGTEVARIRAALADLEARGLLGVTELQTATLSELHHALRRGTYHVLHFIGHGGFDPNSGEGMLAFEDDNRRAHLVSGTDLAMLLQDHRTLRLAVLNACEGARQSPADPFGGVAQALVQNGLPAVVAMQFEITDAAALTLSQEFYSAVADGYPVDAALAEARVAVFSEGNDVEWGTPVLYLRASNGNIFDLAAAPQARSEEARAGRTVAPDSVEAADAAHAAASAAILDATGSLPVVVDDRTPATGVTPAMVVPPVAPPAAAPPAVARPVVAPAVVAPAVVAPSAVAPPTVAPLALPPPRRRLVLALSLVGIVVVVLGVWFASTLPGGGGATTPASSRASAAPGGPTSGASVTSPAASLPALQPQPTLVASRGTAVIDADAGEWPGATTYASDQVVYGADNCVRGQTQLMWDDTALYFLTRVVDSDLEFPDPNQPEKAYAGDAVSLEVGAASAGLPPEAKLRPLDRHYLFGITESASAVVVAANKPNLKLTAFGIARLPAGVEAREARTPDGYLIEGRIPWTAVGLSRAGAGTVLAANVNVSDRDPSVVGRLACMVSTNAQRTLVAQPHPAYWQVLELQD